MGEEAVQQAATAPQGASMPDPAMAVDPTDSGPGILEVSAALLEVSAARAALADPAAAQEASAEGVPEAPMETVPAAVHTEEYSHRLPFPTPQPPPASIPLRLKTPHPPTRPSYSSILFK